MSPGEAREILDSADLICSEDEVNAAVSRVASALNAQMSESNPLLLAIMGGATIFAGQLLPQLTFPLEYDYLHATRYGDAITGGKLEWIVEPRAAIKGRIVVLVDDILDEGITLAAIRDRLLEEGAAQCLIAVFSDKNLGRAKPVVPDFVGLALPNRYVFGFGMDVRGAWRNLPAIYALKE